MIITLFTMLLGAVAFYLLTNDPTITSAMSEATSTQAQGIIAQGTPVVDSSATPSPTSTPTIGYEATANGALATAQAAQATLYVAQMQMVQATSEHEARIQEQLAWTATADNFMRQSANATSQAAPTYIPATQTQSALNAITIATDQSISMTAQVMTQQAPTQIVAIAQAEAQAKAAPLNAYVFPVGMFATMFFLVCFGIVIVRMITPHNNPRITPDLQPAPVSLADQYKDFQGERITVTQSNDGYTSSTIEFVPCNKAQLTLFADRIINGHATLGINNWEGKATPEGPEHWDRKTYLAMRRWMMERRYVHSEGSGVITLTDAGRDFLKAWLDNSTLPHRTEFAPESQQNAMSNAHEYDAHAHDSTGGGGLEPQTA